MGKGRALKLGEFEWQFKRSAALSDSDSFKFFSRHLFEPEAMKVGIGRFRPDEGPRRLVSVPSPLALTHTRNLGLRDTASSNQSVHHRRVILDENDPVTSRVIGAAIAVHRELGPGFIEKIYEEALALALVEAEVKFSRQVGVAVAFHGQSVGEHRLDLLVEGSVVVELKAIRAIEPIHFAIVRSYVKATGARCGLILNFAAQTLQVKRIGPKQKGPDVPV